MSAPSPAVRASLLALQADRLLAASCARSSGAASAPRRVRELYLELTHRCGLACPVCDHPELARRGRGELSAALLEERLSGSKTLDLDLVALGGGEPALSDGLVPLAAFFRRTWPRVRLVLLSHLADTELLLGRLEALRAAGAGPLTLGGSLDGTEATHDRMRARAGAYRALVATVRRVRAEHPGTALSLTFTVTPENCGELSAARRLAVSEFGADFSAQLVLPFPGRPAVRWTPERLAVLEREVDLVLERLEAESGAFEALSAGRELPRPELWRELVYWTRLRAYARAPARFLPDCSAGRLFAMVDPEGGVYLCPSRKELRLGSLAETSFDELWASPKAESARRAASSDGCHCWVRCVAVSALDRLFSGGVR